MGRRRALRCSPPPLNPPGALRPGLAVPDLGDVLLCPARVTGNPGRALPFSEGLADSPIISRWASSSSCLRAPIRVSIASGSGGRFRARCAWLPCRGRRSRLCSGFSARMAATSAAAASGRVGYQETSFRATSGHQAAARACPASAPLGLVLCRSRAGGPPRRTAGRRRWVRLASRSLQDLALADRPNVRVGPFGRVADWPGLQAVLVGGPDLGG